MSAPNHNIMWIITHKALQKQKARFEAEIKFNRTKFLQARAFSDAMLDLNIHYGYYFCGYCETFCRDYECWSMNSDTLDLFMEADENFNTYADCICENCYENENGENICVDCDSGGSNCCGIVKSEDVKTCIYYNDTLKLCITCFDEYMKDKWEDLYYMKCQLWRVLLMNTLMKMLNMS